MPARRGKGEGDNICSEHCRAERAARYHVAYIKVKRGIFVKKNIRVWSLVLVFTVVFSFMSFGNAQALANSSDVDQWEFFYDGIDVFVNKNTGAMHLTVDLVDLSADHSLQLVYNSYLGRWMYNYGEYLVTDGYGYIEALVDETGTSHNLVYDYNNDCFVYEDAPDEMWIQYRTLQEADAAWFEAFYADGTYKLFNADGLLESITYPDGASVSVSYGTLAFYDSQTYQVITVPTDLTIVETEYNLGVEAYDGFVDYVHTTKYNPAFYTAYDADDRLSVITIGDQEWTFEYYPDGSLYHIWDVSVMTGSQAVIATYYYFRGGIDQWEYTSDISVFVNKNTGIMHLTCDLVDFDDNHSLQVVYNSNLARWMYNFGEYIVTDGYGYAQALIDETGTQYDLVYDANYYWVYEDAPDAVTIYYRETQDADNFWFEAFYTDGTCKVFNSDGFLEYIVYPDNTAVSIYEDEIAFFDGITEQVVSLPDGLANVSTDYNLGVYADDGVVSMLPNSVYISYNTNYILGEMTDYYLDWVFDYVGGSLCTITHYYMGGSEVIASYTYPWIQ